MTPIRTIIADDEPKARRRTERMLQKYAEFEVVQSCSDGKETLNAIKKLNPDLVFLDIQMPEYDGFELLEQIEPGHLPRIVFITAYDEFALQAFEVHAIDYLMKPFDADRFEASLQKVKNSIQASPGNEPQNSILELLKTIKDHDHSPDRLMIKKVGKFFFLDPLDIQWIEANGNYVKITCAENHYLVRDSMKNIKSKLNPNIFFRIHRSTIVNIRKIKMLEPWFHGDYKVIMTDGTKFTMTRNYKRLLEVL